MTLILDTIGKQYPSATGETVVALDDISLSIADKEFVCLLGPSGCGKTTLLRIIGGLEHASSGSASIAGQPITGPTHRMVMIFQEYSLYPWRTILENVAFGLEIQGIPREKRHDIAQTYLNLVGLGDFAHHYPYELSGGMRQRVAVARALAVDPDVILMDEPFGALDAQTRNMMQKEILSIWDKTRKTIIFVTHSVDEAIYLSDRIIVLTRRPGRIREIIPVDLPRPRDRTDPAFGTLRRHILQLIEEQGHFQ